MHYKFKLYTTKEAAKILYRAERTIQSWGQRWEAAAKKAKDPQLPSSPSNGLRRFGASRKRALYDHRDIVEYIENELQEIHGQPLLNWRKAAGNE